MGTVGFGSARASPFERYPEFDLADTVKFGDFFLVFENLAPMQHFNQ